MSTICTLWRGKWIRQKLRVWHGTTRNFYHSVLPCKEHGGLPCDPFILYYLSESPHLPKPCLNYHIKIECRRIGFATDDLRLKSGCSYCSYPPNLFKLKMLKTELKLLSKEVLLSAVATSLHSSSIFPKSVTHQKPGRAQQMCLLWFHGYLYNYSKCICETWQWGNKDSVIDRYGLEKVVNVRQEHSGIKRNKPRAQNL